MSIFWTVLEAISFCLPHVKDAIDGLVKRWNPPEEASVLANSTVYLQQANHLCKMLRLLLPEESSLIAEASGLLCRGELLGGVLVLGKLESRLYSQVAGKLLVPMMRCSLSAGNDHSIVELGNQFIGSVRTTFPIAFPRYCSSVRDLYSRVEAADINPVIRTELIDFLHCLQLLEPNRRVLGPYHPPSPTLATWMIHEVESEEEFFKEYPGRGFYTMGRVKQIGEKGAMIMLSPSVHPNFSEVVRTLYDVEEGFLTVENVLGAEVRHPQVLNDPNYNPEAIVNAVLRGRLSTYRSTLASIEDFLAFDERVRHKLPDLTDKGLVKQLIEVNRRCGVGGIEEYLDHLRIYVVSYVYLLSIDWQGEHEHYTRQFDTGRGILHTDPGSGARVGFRPRIGPAPSAPGSEDRESFYPSLQDQPGYYFSQSSIPRWWQRDEVPSRR